MGRPKAKPKHTPEVLYERVRSGQPAFPFSPRQIYTLVQLYYQGVNKRNPRNRPLNRAKLQSKVTTSVIDPDAVPETGQSLVKIIDHDQMAQAMTVLMVTSVSVPIKKTEHFSTQPGWHNYVLRVWTELEDPLSEKNKILPQVGESHIWAACCALTHLLYPFLIVKPEKCPKDT